MRIGWVTPLSAKSAIGRMGVDVCEALARRGHEVEIIRAEDRDRVGNDCYATTVPVTVYDELDAQAAKSRYDVMFLNIGDNYLYHRGVFGFLKEPFAVGVFHDFFLYNLFRGWLETEHGSAAQAHHGEIAATYGADAQGFAEKAWSGEAKLEEIAETAPMTEWLARRCLGAVAHSKFYAERLSGSCLGPVTVADLPWRERDLPARLMKPDGERLLVLTVGYVNPNKCVDAVIEAIGASPTLRERVRYVAAGPIDRTMQEGLERRAGALGVAFEAPGSVSDERLGELLAEADIICTLRRPVLEGASASAIEGMLSGKPIVVADAGFYADLPDDLVAKVSAAVAPGELGSVLERLALDAELRARMGQAARDWARRTFTAERYLESIEDIARRVIGLEPWTRLGNRLADEMTALGVGADDPLVGRIAAAVSGMSGKLGPSPGASVAAA